MFNAKLATHYVALFAFTLNHFKPTSYHVYVKNFLCIKVMCSLPHTSFICFLLFSKQRPLVSLNNIIQFVFVIEKEFVLYEKKTDVQFMHGISFIRLSVIIHDMVAFLYQNTSNHTCIRPDNTTVTKHIHL
jgi:hypothetical protein